MVQGRPVDEATHARVRELHAAGKGRNEIARELGVSASTVSGIVSKLGLSFERTATVAATEARKADLTARRVELKALLLEDAHHLRQQLWEPARLVNFGGKDNTLNETLLDEPLFADKKNIMSAVGIAMTAFDRLDAKDNDGGDSEARSMLAQLGRALGIVQPVDNSAATSDGN